MSSRVPRRETIILSPESTLFSPTLLPPRNAQRSSRTGRALNTLCTDITPVACIAFCSRQRCAKLCSPRWCGSSHVRAPAFGRDHRAASPTRSITGASSLIRQPPAARVARTISSPQDQCKGYSRDRHALGPAPTLAALLLEFLELKHQCS